MAKRFTYEFVKEQFEKENYELLSTEYINNKQKLEYMCPKGHTHSVCWSDWQQGRRCGYCAGHYYTIENIRESFVDEGYTLLTKKYINCAQKLGYICPKGHKHNISWNAWRNQGQRCPFCYGNVKSAIEFIRSEFEKENYMLLAKEYENCSQKLEYICPNGHKHSITWGNWKVGWRCPICFHIKLSGHNHPNWKGGITCEPYCDAWADKEYKKSILERDNYTCQNPDCWGTMPEDLTIHHIDYNKKNCGPENLITLCRSCNSRANFNREWHTNYYNEIMRRRNLDNEL